MENQIKKPVKILNLVVAVIFVLLFAVHCYMLAHIPEWNKQYEGFWPTFDTMLVRPLLDFTTGYALFSALFSLLKAKLEIEGLGRRNLLRIVMSVITLFFVAVLIFGLLILLGVDVGLTPAILGFAVDICQAEWLWLILGIYWFLSLNALRYAELRPLEDDDEEDF